MDKKGRRQAGGTDGLRHTKPKPRKDAKGGHKGKATSEDFSYTQNREVSWLRFDDRVLDEAFDETVRSSSASSSSPSSGATSTSGS